MCENYFRLEVYLICLKYFSALVQFTNSEFLNFIIADEISFLKVRVFDSMGFDKLFYVFGLKYKCNIDPSSQWHNEATKFLVYVIEFIQLFDIIWVSGLATFAQFINQITKVFFKFILQNKILYCRASERSSASRKVKRTKLYLYLLWNVWQNLGCLRLKIVIMTVACITISRLCVCYS